MLQPFLPYPAVDRHGLSTCLNPAERLDVSLCNVSPIAKCVHQLMVAFQIDHLPSCGGGLGTEGLEEPIQCDCIVSTIDYIARRNEHVMSARPGDRISTARDERCHGEDVECVLQVAVQIGNCHRAPVERLPSVRKDYAGPERAGRRMIEYGACVGGVEAVRSVEQRGQKTVHHKAECRRHGSNPPFVAAVVWVEMVR